MSQPTRYVMPRWSRPDIPRSFASGRSCCGRGPRMSSRSCAARVSSGYDATPEVASPRSQNQRMASPKAGLAGFGEHEVDLAGAGVGGGDVVVVDLQHRHDAAGRERVVLALGDGE